MAHPEYSVMPVAGRQCSRQAGSARDWRLCVLAQQAQSPRGEIDEVGAVTGTEVAVDAGLGAIDARVPTIERGGKAPRATALAASVT